MSARATPVLALAGALVLALVATRSGAETASPFAIRARTFDGTSWHDGAIVVVSSGRIESLRTGAPAAPPGVALLEVDDAILTPGLIDCDSALGLDSGRDELPEAASPDLLIADAFAPDDGESLALRRSGVTLAWLAAGPASVVGGRGAFIQPTAERPRVLDRSHGSCGSLTDEASPPERAPSSMAEQARLLAAVEDLDGPLRIRFDDAGSARLAAGIQGSLLVGLPATDETLEELRPADGVIVSGLSSRTSLDVLRPAVLLARVMPFAIGSGESPAGPRAIRLAAARLVEAGAPADRVLAALTSEAGRLAGTGGRGVIAAGHPADLVLWSGNPLSPSSRVLRAWVSGAEVFRAD